MLPRTARPVAAALSLAVAWLLATGSPALAQGDQDPASSAPEKTIIVLDASGSMWGQIDGRSKIEIAREALDELLAGWESGAEVGLTAYGHRRKGDCGDIETLVDPDGGGPAAVRRAVGELDPKGKTPLTAAVRQAAERLRYREAPARVILISDGRESCGADPCSLGSELERTGVDFTAHVVGFDVAGPAQSGLRCLAENTGGHFYEATEASELQAALARAGERARSAEARVTLKAVDRPDGPALRSDRLRWTVAPAGGGEPVMDGKAVAVPRLDLEAGAYRVRVRMGEAGAEERIEVSGDGSSVHELVLELDASLEVPSTASATAPVEIGWSGPGAEEDYITIVSEGTPQGQYNDESWAYVSEGDPLTIRAPAEAGTYQVRYLSGRSGTILARAPLEVTATEASLQAPEQVGAATSIEVGWQGPGGEEDYVTVVEEGAPASQYDEFEYTSAGNPLSIRAPAEPGTYELRYVSGQGGEILARQTVRVQQATASLEAPRRVSAGSSFQVRWQGPDGEDDYVTIVREGAAESQYGNYAYTADGNPLTLEAPEEAGAYELRYITGTRGAILARRTITVQ